MVVLVANVYLRVVVRADYEGVGVSPPDSLAVELRESAEAFLIRESAFMGLLIGYCIFENYFNYINNNTSSPLQIDLFVSNW